MKLSLVLTQCASLSFSALVVSQSLAATVDFRDVPQNAWYAGFVRQAATMGIVSGYADANGNLTGYFGPSDSVSVTQALKMEIGSVGIDVNSYHLVTPENFGNAPGLVLPYSDKWWYNYYLIAKEQHVSTVECGFIPEPDRPMRRWEMARLIADVYQVTPSAPTDLDQYAGGVLSNVFPTMLPNPYSDVDATIALEAGSTIAFPADPSQKDLFEYAQDSSNRTAILKLTSDGVLAGDVSADGERQFRPLDTLNRAEAVKILLTAQSIYSPSQAAKPASFDLPNMPPLACTR